MRNEQAFAALTLLVAACEQALVELDEMEPTPDVLVKRLIETRDEAAETARDIACSNGAAGATATR